ncbi:MAG TPA: YggS family pyridoxal phosphate-dependent enzyme [Saprospiraceae bacterium]|nr:YggS family pyridoxal phosphate-dependent enzyme [Saprospiraceae bacterium]
MPKPFDSYLQVRDICESHDVTLVAVSKTRTLEEMIALYHLGQRVFAENRAQELVAKAPLMPADVKWHLIGHLQTNKVRMILPHVTCIQSLDSEKLWLKIHEEASRINQPMDCLLEIKIAEEETKYGFDFNDLLALLNSGKTKAWNSVRIIGLMGMASLTDDHNQVHAEMRKLKTYFDELKSKYYSSDPEFKWLSMGMSGDYEIAIEEGSNMVRIGTKLFS